MEFSHQSNLERGVRYFNFESNFLVGDQEDVSEAPEDAAPVIARSLQVACVHIESFQKVLIQHIGEAETMGHSFDDGRRFVREVWSARRGIDVVMDISRLGIGDGLDLGDNDAVLQLQLVQGYLQNLRQLSPLLTSNFSANFLGGKCRGLFRKKPQIL